MNAHFNIIFLLLLTCCKPTADKKTAELKNLSHQIDEVELEITEQNKILSEHFSMSDSSDAVSVNRAVFETLRTQYSDWHLLFDQVRVEDSGQGSHDGHDHNHDEKAPDLTRKQQMEVLLQLYGDVIKIKTKYDSLFNKIKTF
jgi:predicted glycosyl hydrolase (DUF1957 family)